MLAGPNRCARSPPLAASPWPEPPPGPRGRTEEEALWQRIKDARTPSHVHTGPVGAALLWMNLKDPTSVAHSSHVFMKYPPPNTTRCGTHITMPRRQGTGPTHALARHRAQEAAVRDLVAGAVVEVHTAHAAALQEPAGGMRAFFCDAALLAVRALNGAGALTLLPTMHRIVNAVHPGLSRRSQRSSQR